MSVPVAPEPLFRRDGDLFVPTGHTRGPWDPGQMHGGAPTALLAQALCALVPGMIIARLSFDFLGVVALEPVQIEVEIVRPGRRFAVLEGRLGAGGRDSIVVRAVALAPGAVDLPDAARWRTPAPASPQAGRTVAFPAPPGAPTEGMHLTGMEIRCVAGSIAQAGPAVAWLRLSRALIDDEPAVPLARVCAAADFGNGVSRVVDFETHLFVNTDLTVSLLREPAGAWVCLDAATRIDPAGIGWAASTLHDERGPIGFSQQTLFVRER